MIKQEVNLIEKYRDVFDKLGKIGKNVQNKTETGSFSKNTFTSENSTATKRIFEKWIR